MPSSGYAAITFVANEQPTTAKWNLIGSNDSSFNLGTGLEDSVILTRHIAAANITGPKLAIGSVMPINVRDTSAEITYTSGSYTTPPGLSQSITTDKASQKILVLARINAYTGGNITFRLTVDGTAVGTQPSKWNNSAINATTTGAVILMEEAVITTAGAHTIAFQINPSAAGARVITSEGDTLMSIITQ
jgi:hypothetical protein